MEVLQTVLNAILGLGSSIFVPLIILILGLVVRMKFSQALISALTLGVGLIGMDMVIGYMSDGVGPASEALSENTGVTLPALDLGGGGTGAIVYSWPITVAFFALMIGINVVMLLLNWTKTMNVDMWSVWSKGLTAWLVYYVSHSIALCVAAAAIQIILELKLGDVLHRHIEDITGIPLITVPHFMTMVAVLMYPINLLLDYIPFFNQRLDATALREKIGIFSDNKVIGFIIGTLLGFAGAYSVTKSLGLGLIVATSLAIFPTVSKMFMEALSPLADAVSVFMKDKFKGREIYIGVDWPVLAGSAELWVTAILMVPFTILFAVTLPGVH